MPTIRKDFCLDETVAGSLRALCENYHLDGSWLAWQFEKHILVNGASPFRVETGAYGHPIKEGIQNVKFEVEFDSNNPNVLKWIRFDELPSKKSFVITQTSVKHMREGVTCPLWLEVPKSTETREDIGAVQSLLRVKLCCDEWIVFIPDEPETALERAQLTVADENINRLKNEVASKRLLVDKMYSALRDLKSDLSQKSGALAFKKIEAEALARAVEKLNGEKAALNDRIEQLEGEIKNGDKSAEKLKTALADLELLNNRHAGLFQTNKALLAEKKEMQAELNAKKKMMEEASDFLDSESPSKKRKKTVIKICKTPKTPKTPKTGGKDKSGVLGTPQTVTPQVDNRPRIAPMFPNLSSNTSVAANSRDAAASSMLGVMGLRSARANEELSDHTMTGADHAYLIGGISASLVGGISGSASIPALNTRGGIGYSTRSMQFSPLRPSASPYNTRNRGGVGLAPSASLGALGDDVFVRDSHSGELGSPIEVSSGGDEDYIPEA
ncbi:unnamed protein product [Discula destructiva]